MARPRWNIKINKGTTQAIYFFRRLRVPDYELQLNGRNIPTVNTVKYLDVIFARRMTWRLHVERTAAKALPTHIRTYSLFRSERLSISNKFTLYKAPIRSIIAYVCLNWDYAADAKLLKLQRLQHRFLHNIRNIVRSTPVYEVHMALRNPYVYNFITKLCRNQREVIQKHLNPNVFVAG
jgi:hypothetical protein